MLISTIYVRYKPTFIIDLAVTINVSLSDHLIDLKLNLVVKYFQLKQNLIKSFFAFFLLLSTISFLKFCLT